MRRWEWIALALLLCALVGLALLTRGGRARGERPAAGAVYVLARGEERDMPPKQGNVLPGAALEWRAGPGENETRRQEREGGLDGWKDGR